MRRGAIVGCLLLVLAPALGADAVVPRKGKAIRGTVRRDGDAVLVNPYYATSPEMTWGVVRIPAEAVKEIREEEPAELPSGPAQPWDAKPDLRRALGSVLLLDSAMARRTAAGELRAAHAPDLGPQVVEPLARAWRAPRGTRHEVRLRDATYSIHVPESYHPLTPVPVVVGLHGGLHRNREDGRYVFLGSARDVFALLEGEATSRGWILVCPNAIEAPWTARNTAALVDSVLDDVEALYAVDRSRRYVVGLGAGADAALRLAASHPKRFAAAGAASATEPVLARAVASRRVPVWLYQGEASDRTPVADARKAADQLRKQRRPFAYLELPAEGHGLPRVAEADLYRFLETQARTQRPDSSLAAWAERDADGIPWGHAWGDLIRLPSDELIARLRRGGWDAEAAARGLLGAASRPETGRISAILANQGLPVGARRWAAWLLGWLADPSAVPALGDAVRAETEPEIRRAAVKSLRILGPGGAVGDLWQAFEDVTRAFTHASPPRTLAGYRNTLLLAAETIEALALAGADQGEELLPAIEEKVLIGLLKEGPVPPMREHLGEAVDDVRARLARAVGRVYRKLNAEATLLDMLQVALRRDPSLLQAANQGFEEGLAAGRDRSADRPRWD